MEITFQIKCDSSSDADRFYSIWHIVMRLMAAGLTIEEIAKRLANVPGAFESK